jgi:hypothetical protein
VIDAFLPKEERYVLEVNYEMKRAKSIENEHECLQEQFLHVLDVDEVEECKIVRRRILDTYGAILYKTWLTKVSLALGSDGKVVIKEASSGFIRDYVENNFLK